MISFIVPAYNEEHLIEASLESIAAAAPNCSAAWELIVVDDASTDGTAAIARRCGAQVVQVAHRQIAAARNSGARQAKGNILVFVDADTLINENVVKAAVNALREGAVGGGASVHFDGRLPLYARVLLPSSIWFSRVAGLAAGCFFFCRREAFDAVGGFDERFFCAEELVLAKALKRRGRFVILRQAVTTSGRKLRAYPPLKLLKLIAAMARRGRRSLMQREGLELWYKQR